MARNFIFSDVSVIKGQVKHKTHLMNVLVSVEFDILADFERNVTFSLHDLKSQKSKTVSPRWFKLHKMFKILIDMGFCWMNALGAY